MKLHLCLQDLGLAHVGTGHCLNVFFWKSTLQKLIKLPDNGNTGSEEFPAQTHFVSWKYSQGMFKTLFSFACICRKGEQARNLEIFILHYLNSTQKHQAGRKLLRMKMNFLPKHNLKSRTSICLSICPSVCCKSSRYCLLYRY